MAASLLERLAEDGAHEAAHVDPSSLLRGNSGRAPAGKCQAVRGQLLTGGELGLEVAVALIHRLALQLGGKRHLLPGQLLALELHALGHRITHHADSDVVVRRHAVRRHAE